jgi:magnesium-protoporphyrin IX monomethyl ester (oxidative) cyclase
MINDWTSPINPVDVALVLMPYAAIERPSIALSILKTVLAQEQITNTVVYGNLMFAEEIGVYAHDIIGKTQSHSLGGEWTFASAAFPGFQCDEEAYFEHIGPGLTALTQLVHRHGGQGTTQGILRAVRRRTPDFIDRLARRLLEARPRIVGCSSTFQQHCASLALLRRIKELEPSVVTVIGGANCESSMGLATHRECPWLDYVVSGEGEEVFRKLCLRVLRSNEAHDPDRDLLPGEAIGPAFRRMDATDEPLAVPRVRIENMTQSPMPDYTEYFTHLRARPVGFYINPGLLIETSRGCWWGAVSHCTFCGLNGTSMGFRSKPADQVVREFNTLSQTWGLKSFEVVDNILDMGYLKSVIPTLTEENAGYDIFYETKANLSRDHLKRLSDSGIRWLQPGIESLDDDLLRAIAKGTTTRQNLQLLKWAHDYGIYILWILLYDIPGEDDALYARMAEWLPLIEHLQPPSGFSFIQFNRFSPYHQRPQEFGLTLSPDKSYGFVYPWAAENIEQFAYFFDDYTIDRDLVGNIARSPRRPGLKALQAAMSTWQISWVSRMNATDDPANGPQLIAEDQGERVVLCDSRACRTEARIELEGLAADVYRACDRAQTQGLLQRTLAALPGGAPDWDAVEAVLADLCARKVLLALDDWYFALGTRTASRALNIARYPGGRLRTFAEAHAAENYRYAERKMGIGARTATVGAA